MILECAECHNRYLVPDHAIGTDGRTVRCANCRHSWFQQPALLGADVRKATTARTGDYSGEIPRAAAAEPPKVYSDEPGYDPYAHSPPFKPRRNPAKRWTAAAMIAGVSMLAGTVAIVYTGTPSIAKQMGFPIGVAETPLRLIDNPIERRKLSSGNELFAVSGRVNNPTSQRQRVPDIRADLRDAQGRLVYSWTITPPARSLGPNGNIEFNSAKLDVPASSHELILSFSAGI